MVANLTPLFLSVDGDGNLVHVAQTGVSLDRTLETALKAQTATKRKIQLTFMGVDIAVEKGDTLDSLRETYNTRRGEVVETQSMAIADLRLSLNQRSTDFRRMDETDFLVWLADYLDVVDEAGFAGLTRNAGDVYIELNRRGYISNNHMVQGPYLKPSERKKRIEYAIGLAMASLRTGKAPKGDLGEKLRAIAQRRQA